MARLKMCASVARRRLPDHGGLPTLLGGALSSFTVGPNLVNENKLPVQCTTATFV